MRFSFITKSPPSPPMNGHPMSKPSRPKRRFRPQHDRLEALSGTSTLALGVMTPAVTQAMGMNPAILAASATLPNAGAVDNALPTTRGFESTAKALVASPRTAPVPNGMPVPKISDLSGNLGTGPAILLTAGLIRPLSLGATEPGVAANRITITPLAPPPATGVSQTLGLGNATSRGPVSPAGTSTNSSAAGMIRPMSQFPEMVASVDDDNATATSTASRRRGGPSAWPVAASSPWSSSPGGDATHAARNWC